MGINKTEYQRDKNELQYFAELLNNNAEKKERSQSDLNRLLTRLDYHGISALVGEVTTDITLKQALSPRRALMIANEQLRSRELALLLSALAKAGLERYLIFKGTALAHTVYPQAWLRPRTDTDMLIEHSHLKAFSAVFEQQGYQRQFAISGDYVSYQCTFGKQLVGEASINIDVHWRINNRQCLANTIAFDELFDAAEHLSELGSNVPCPNSIDSLMIACLHRLGHHHTEERLTWLYDIHLLANSLTAAQWPVLAHLAKQRGLSALCLDGLKTSALYLGTNADTNALEELASADLSTQPSRLFLQRDLPAWKVFISDITAIKPMTGKLRFIYETAVPSPSYIRQQMGTQSALYGYLLRAFRGLKRMFA